MLKLSQIILHNEFVHKTIKVTARIESQYNQYSAMKVDVTVAVLQKHEVMTYRYIQ